MRKISNKFIIFGVMAILFLSAILCCCLTPKVEAQEIPSCHQTTREDTQQSSHTDECDCSDSISILTKLDQGILFVQESLVIHIDSQYQYEFVSPQFISYPEVFEIADQTVPFSLQNSILRI